MTIPKHATAALVLADGKVFYGQGVGAKGTTVGEICFNTGLTGYQETLTDPSYAGQIITFTFPHIGNVGTNNDDAETQKPAVRGLIMREAITSPSSHRNEQSLQEWLESKELTGISGVDTRELTRYIRVHGAQNVAIQYFTKKSEYDYDKLHGVAKNHPSLKGMELGKTVTRKKSAQWTQTQWQQGAGHGEQKKPKYKVVAVDYGAKLNILRCLADVGCDVTVVPAATSAQEILSHKPDGVFLSNGPGDPSATGVYALPVIRALLQKETPIFGICLGHQLLALALGCDTTKMHQGHRGANHPVQDLATGAVEITSQNHGFVVTKESVGEDVEVTHLSLFDGSIEGIRSKSKPAFSVQYHPEASPGTHDSFYLFERFVKLMKKHQGNK